MAAAAATSQNALASRVTGLKNEGAYAVLAAAQALEAEGRDVVHLEIGQPAYPTPDHVVEAGVAALRGGQTKYSAPAGVAALRDAIAAHVNATRGLDGAQAVSGANVVVGPGAKPGIFAAALALVEPGDEVVYPDPGFPSYGAAVDVCAGAHVPVALTADGAGFDMNALEAAMSERTKLIIANSPGNPTGGVMPAADVRRMCELAKKYDAWVISDEIYSRLVYDSAEGACLSPLAVEGMAERTVMVDGFSKTYCMTGWRLGWAVAPAALAERMELLNVHNYGCTATFTQAAGLAALEGPQDSLEEMRAEYERRRDFVVGALNAMEGVHCPEPAGAFYAFPDTSALGMKSADLASLLLQEGGVALLPGTDFGAQGEGKLRLSYVSSMAELEEGLTRMEKVLRGL